MENTNFFNSIKEWLIDHHVPAEWTDNFLFWSTLGGLLAGSVYKLTTREILRRQRNLLNKNLRGKFTAADVRRATSNNIKARFQFLSPVEVETNKDIDKVKRHKLNKRFLNDYFSDHSDEKYFILFAGVGMGKSTAMINLYLAYKQHRWLKGKRNSNIHLIPLGDKNAIENINKIQNKEDSILLLDAFDEDPNAIEDYSKRINELIKTAEPFFKVLLTCRSQFFPSQVEEPSKTDDVTFGIEQIEYNFLKIYLSPFNNFEIILYLLKIYFSKLWNPSKWKEYLNARRITKKSSKLMIRPMLLAYVRDVAKEQKSDYEFQYQIYEVLIKKWIQRESSKSVVRLKYNSSTFEQQLYSISNTLAINMHNNWNLRGGLFINIKDMIPKSVELLSDISNEKHRKFGESQWRSHSLLNRDADGNYKFAHRSILEFFIAGEAFHNKEFYLKIEESRLNAVKNFIKEMCISKIIRVSNGHFEKHKVKNYFVEDPNYTTSLPLRYVNLSNIDSINFMRIDLLPKIDFHSLSLSIPKSIAYVILTNLENTPILYICYILVNKKVIHLKSNRSYIDSYYTLNMLSALQYLGLYDLISRLKLMSLLKNRGVLARVSQNYDALVDKVKDLKIVMQFKEMLNYYQNVVLSAEKIDSIDRKMNLEKKYPQVIESLISTNQFIRNCNFVSEKFKKGQILY